MRSAETTTNCRSSTPTHVMTAANAPRKLLKLPPLPRSPGTTS
jgi:hypothetical protein